MPRRASRGPEFVFGYGSLAAAGSYRPTRTVDERGFVTDLRGVARGWGVAMDNSVDLPGYKFYEAEDGVRPQLFVAFLDLREEPDGRVNGLCLPIDDDRLAALDRRERNYVRVEVSDRLAAPVGGRAWTYVGSPAGRERLHRGRASGRAVIQARYLDAVRAGFARLGTGELEACAPSLDPGGLPVLDLLRRELTEP